MKHSSKRRSSPKKTRAIPTSRHLHVAAHRHTGHLIHRRTTSYPTLAMILLCVGVFLGSWSHYVTADPAPIANSYTVHASVPGPAPGIAATIDSPTAGTVFTSLPITVTGSCPINTYETLYRNGAFSGVVICDINGRYEIETGLFPGSNQLQIRDFSPTDVPGPMSSSVHVTYSPPVPPSSGSSSGSSNGSSAGTSSGSAKTQSSNSTNTPVTPKEPLILKTMFNYQGHYVGENSSWELDVEGGSEPYAISIDWGDGNHSLVSRAHAGTFTIDHVYKKSGAYHGNYVTKLTASDAEGTQTYLQLLAIINDPPAAATGHTKSPIAGFTNTTPTYLSHIMKYIWPSYGVVSLMLASFWLGERHEIPRLKPHPKKARRG